MDREAEGTRERSGATVDHLGIERAILTADRGNENLGGAIAIERNLALLLPVVSVERACSQLQTDPSIIVCGEPVPARKSVFALLTQRIAKSNHSEVEPGLCRRPFNADSSWCVVVRAVVPTVINAGRDRNVNRPMAQGSDGVGGALHPR